MRYFFILFILFSTKVFSGIPIPEAHSKFSGKVFVISIGVDKYVNPICELNFCQSDADYFLKFLERDTSIKEIIKYTLRDDSTKDQLISAFNEVAKHATMHDLFIFYYAGK